MSLLMKRCSVLIKHLNLNDLLSVDLNDAIALKSIGMDGQYESSNDESDNEIEVISDVTSNQFQESETEIITLDDSDSDGDGDGVQENGVQNIIITDVKSCASNSEQAKLSTSNGSKKSKYNPFVQSTRTTKFMPEVPDLPVRVRADSTQNPKPAAEPKPAQLIGARPCPKSLKDKEMRKKEKERIRKKREIVANGLGEGYVESVHQAYNKGKSNSTAQDGNCAPKRAEDPKNLPSTSGSKKRPASPNQTEKTTMPSSSETGARSSAKGKYNGVLPSSSDDSSSGEDTTTRRRSSDTTNDHHKTSARSSAKSKYDGVLADSSDDISSDKDNTTSRRSSNTSDSPQVATRPSERPAKKLRFDPATVGSSSSSHDDIPEVPAVEEADEGYTPRFKPDKKRKAHTQSSAPATNLPMPSSSHPTQPPVRASAPNPSRRPPDRPPQPVAPANQMQQVGGSPFCFFELPKNSEGLLDVASSSPITSDFVSMVVDRKGCTKVAYLKGPSVEGKTKIFYDMMSKILRQFPEKNKRPPRILFCFRHNDALNNMAELFIDREKQSNRNYRVVLTGKPESVWEKLQDCCLDHQMQLQIEEKHKKDPHYISMKRSRDLMIEKKKRFNSILKDQSRSNEHKRRAAGRDLEKVEDELEKMENSIKENKRKFVQEKKKVHHEEKVEILRSATVVFSTIDLCSSAEMRDAFGKAEHKFSCCITDCTSPGPASKPINLLLIGHPDRLSTAGGLEPLRKILY